MSEGWEPHGSGPYRLLTFVSLFILSFSGITVFSSFFFPFCFQFLRHLFAVNPLWLFTPPPLCHVALYPPRSLSHYTSLPPPHSPTNRWVVCPETEVQGHQRGAGPRPQRHDFHVIFSLLHLLAPPCISLPCTTTTSPSSSRLVPLPTSASDSVVSVPTFEIVIQPWSYIVLQF